MKGARSELNDLWLIGLLSLAFGAFFVGALIRATREEPERIAGAVRLAGTTVDVDVERATGHLTLRDHGRSPDAPPLMGADLALWVDGEIRQIALKPTQIDLVDRRTVEAHFPLVLPSGRTHAVLRLSLQAGSADVLVASLSVSGKVAAGSTAPTVAPALAFSAEGKPLFVSGVGEVGDVGNVAGSSLTFERAGRGIGLVSSRGGVAVEVAGEIDHEMHLEVVPPSADVGPQPSSTDLALVVTAPGAAADVWGAVYAFAGERTALVRGFVTGTSFAKERSTVYGMGEESASDVRVTTGPDGRFSFLAPRHVTHWYAALDPSRTSAAVDYRPGAGFDLKLDVSPGGELLVRVEDGDTHEPLTARLIVHGVEGTLDPSFGPDYRATGAGPLIDALKGEVATPLPAGRYRVAATRGLEWSIDAETVEILPGRQVKLVLRPRHVVPTPGEIDCDLHVHARPSFDSPVSPEDRIASLVAAGIEFAVPTEHNLVGDYTAPLETLGMTRELATVTGTEVTTFSPSFGHFGVFPLPADAKIPYSHTTLGALFAAAKKGSPDRVLVVHHPRLGKGLGYFSIAGFEPAGEDQKPRVPATMRTDFDAVEVYNGYEFADAPKVELVMRDYYALLNLGRYAATGSSDSHRIQYLWAGYPRTIVHPENSDADLGADDAQAAPLTIVRAIKQGRSVVTSGPYIELTLPAGSQDAATGSLTSSAKVARPGDTAIVRGDALKVHVVVRAAPWVDVSSLEIVSAGDSLAKLPIPPRPEVLGPEAGTLEEAQARTLRFEGDLDVVLPENAHWVLAVARGTRKLDDILPFMPITPLAMTNPVYLDRRP